ncbi:sugar transferase [Nocardioides panacisoli]|uniref:sugar transferase n=1 Tax=Nocardioides panacisoli TaxID=627624 RepID=UPI001C629156|nr:sugar transferase [Nocardioides panacisoli]QYJ02988.1 sugar transferase [Nocardioides panacisoli]
MTADPSVHPPSTPVPVPPPTTAPPEPRRVRHERLKRGLDVSVAWTLLVGLAPLLVLIAALVRLDTRGPALFRQERIGQGGRRIRVYKFRSMVADAERMRAPLESHNEVAAGPLFKMRRDPRITRVGRWLRRTSLDELPQLINVARGSMSLVGPRPALPHEVEQYPADVHRRLWVKPGMTGLWQVSGRSDLPWEEAIALDLHYVEHQSIGLDLSVLARTVPAVVKGRGAY